MFENQLPQFPDLGRSNYPPAKPYYTNPIPQFYPEENNPPQGWGISAMITAMTTDKGATGRGEKTLWWAGLPNLYWWCDRKNGLAGIIATQILPFAGD